MQSVTGGWRAVVVFAATLAAAGCGAGKTVHQAATPSGPPPEWARNAAAWPSHDAGLANARANLRTDIDAANVRHLRQKWTFKLPHPGPYGAFTSNPIVLGGRVYLEDTDSTVYALNASSGTLVWRRAYHSPTPSGGPNGVAYGYGLLFGETEGAVFALDPMTGRQVWIHKLTSNSREGIDMAPQLYDGKVLISTIPGNSRSFYLGGAVGTVFALDARTGKVDWSFSTVKDPQSLWGNPKVNGGGGLWYPPAVDSENRVFLGVGNPGPYPNSPADPNAKSRPGPNLYTDSLVALNGSTGKLLWYRQVTPHDLRDYDFQDPPILVTKRLHGRKTEIVIGAGKSGKVVAFRAADGRRLWTLNIGHHNRYQYGPLPAKPVQYCPGSLGGVLTPMAESAGRLFVPWIDVCFDASATGLTGGQKNRRGGLAAIAPGTGAVLWKHRLPDLDAGAATIARNVVFTSTLTGAIYALSTRTGSVLWSTKAPGGIDSFPAVTKRMLIVGAGARTSRKNPHGELVAYGL